MRNTALKHILLIFLLTVSYQLVLPQLLNFSKCWTTPGISSPLVDLIHLHGLKCHLITISMLVSSPFISSELQTVISNCLLNMSAWLSNGHLKVNTSITEVLLFFLKPALHFFHLSSWQLCSFSCLGLMFCSYLWFLSFSDHTTNLLSVPVGCIPKVG